MHTPLKLTVGAAVAIALSATCAAWAGDVYVVTSAAAELSPDEVREVFLGDKQFAGALKLAPVENTAVQSDFLAKVMKVDAAKYASIWAKKGFRDGLTPPPAKGGDGEVLAAIKANPGTVGYVSKPTPDVKVIRKY